MVICAPTRSGRLTEDRMTAGYSPREEVTRRAKPVNGTSRLSYCRRRASSVRREGAARTFFGGGLAWGVPGGYQGACRASKLLPVFRAGKRWGPGPRRFPVGISSGSGLPREVAPLEPTCFASSRRHSHPIS
jgi:hypothetical protein